MYFKFFSRNAVLLITPLDPEQLSALPLVCCLFIHLSVSLSVFVYVGGSSIFLLDFFDQAWSQEGYKTNIARFLTKGLLKGNCEITIFIYFELLSLFKRNLSNLLKCPNFQTSKGLGTMSNLLQFLVCKLTILCCFW